MEASLSFLRKDPDKKLEAIILWMMASIDPDSLGYIILRLLVQ